MANNIIDASTVDFNPKDKILFDCNVLMYLFYTYGKYANNQIKIYKSLFNNAITKKCKLYIPSIEISEFINTYIKAEYRRYLRKNNCGTNFKFKRDYRITTDYQDVITDIKNIINGQILSVFTKLDDDFSSIDISNIYYTPGQFDFNDRYYCKLAEKHSLMIITNDEDFSSNSNLKIITANKQLLHNGNNSQK